MSDIDPTIADAASIDRMDLSFLQAYPKLRSAFTAAWGEVNTGLSGMMLDSNAVGGLQNQLAIIGKTLDDLDPDTGDLGQAAQLGDQADVTRWCNVANTTGQAINAIHGQVVGNNVGTNLWTNVVVPTAQQVAAIPAAVAAAAPKVAVGATVVLVALAVLVVAWELR